MSNTILSFWDFFWIWWIMVVAGGGTTYLQKNTESIDALKKQVADLTEAVRNLRGGRDSAT